MDSEAARGIFGTGNGIFAQGALIHRCMNDTQVRILESSAEVERQLSELVEYQVAEQEQSAKTEEAGLTATG